MASKDTSGGRRDQGLKQGLPLPVATVVGFALAFTAVCLIGAYSLVSQHQRIALVERLARSSLIVERSQAVMSAIQDAETGQRGYLLTGEEKYLAPYEQARLDIDARLKALAEFGAGDAQMTQNVQSLRSLVDDKLKELESTISLRRAGDGAAAMAIVRTDRGKNVMDRIRSHVAAIYDEAQAASDVARREWSDDSAASQALNVGGSVLLLVLIAMAAAIAWRDFRAQGREAWLRAGQGGLAERLQGERRLEVLGARVLSYLTQWLDAPVGALHLVTEDGRLHGIAGHALPPDRNLSDIASGSGLAGQVVKDGRLLHLRDVPADYWPVASSVGAASARELVIAPAILDGTVLGVIELGFFRKVSAAELELLGRVSETLAISVRSARDRSRLEELLEESQRQTEELHAQQEELRVSNEELEERGRALTSSQAQLETQQAELEQSNMQLGEQARLLERHNDHLQHTQHTLAAKAAELEQASRYKSEFLANMSHELRTPLNSTLILAKLLSDNSASNLTDEQVEFARTIHSAGQDLLGLINDILELSKIEAGQVSVMRERVGIAAAVDAAVGALRPLAMEKSLELVTSIDATVPERLDTDARRLAQILRNLLANALKFTERGRVSVQVRNTGLGFIAFDVTDTGIGIATDQQQAIFEAFRQADGSIQRKYGGTGLGLSISRDLARLLGGDITLSSTVGAGSTFTLTLPLQWPAGLQAGTDNAPMADASPTMIARARLTARTTAPAVGHASALPVPAVAVPAVAPARIALPAIEDDRSHLTPGKRLILIVEDDPNFATILRDVAHELDFECIIAHNGHDGLSAAARFKPNGVLLDINLPDQSGLSVLEELKQNAQLRHIPVHALSGDDFAREAMLRGAVGYALKPLQRSDLVNALRRLEATFTPRLRRVLVVEDDDRQRQSVAALLGHRDVEVVGVATASAALQRLQQVQFDCVVMDLNLPDLSGYELLERMADSQQAAFPPVIVYTGRSLTREEEDRLSRHSHSIIVKGARSPERLLDEVTLFLHQVEADLPPESRRLLRTARDRDAAFEGRRILVAEDDARNIFALSRVLEPRGAKVEIARNGREALNFLERTLNEAGPPIDLVLMDLMMPVMDGLTAIREIRRQPSWQRLPIIALTAKAMKDDRDRCLEAGANDYCAKPLDVDKLVALIRVWMPS
jgi:CheY-like chemotaxis protein/CHASE3 domain sensor protein